MDHNALIEGASRHWHTIAGFAWSSSRAGKGAVVVHGQDVLGETAPVMNWFSAADVPAGDDFRTLMQQSDPETHVVLIVVTAQDDVAIVLKAEGDRPSPETCAKQPPPKA